jgi:transcriptional regulator with XRE-family HTH domain
MDTPKDLPRDIGGFIRDLRHNARISLRQLAEQAGVSNPYLSQIERGLRKPSAEVLQQLASALRVSTPAMYLRAGLLDSEGQPGVLAAIAADPELSVAQKQSLSQIYETFRSENARHARTSDAPTGDAPTGADVAETSPTATDPAQTGRTSADQLAGPGVPAGEAARQQAAVIDSVAAVENGATPAPDTADEAPTTTPTPAKKATRRAATKAAPAAQEEKS